MRTEAAIFAGFFHRAIALLDGLREVGFVYGKRLKETSGVPTSGFGGRREPPDIVQTETGGEHDLLFARAVAPMKQNAGQPRFTTRQAGF